MTTARTEPKPLIGVLMLETSFPRIKGDIGNPDSFDFPLAYRIVSGASPRRVVEQADPALLEPFIRTGQELIKAGVKALTTSCGFLAMFQPQLAQALSVPVYTSSLLQATELQAGLKPGRKVGIITIAGDSLTDRHLAGVGLQPGQCPIVGLSRTSHFASVFLDQRPGFDESRCRTEMARAARRLVDAHPEVEAVVLECTNMPPYAAEVRRLTGLPVFDITTLINRVHRELTA